MMNRTLKKILVITGLFFVVVFGVLMAMPFVFKDEIMIKAKQELNAMLNAKVDFKDIDMSFIRNFPYASVQLEEFSVVGVGEFQKDTLIYSDDVNLVLNIKSLFADTGYDIRKLIVNDSKLSIRVLPNGKANWDIMKPDTVQTVDTAAMNFHLKLKAFEINNAQIKFNYEPSNMVIVFENLNHSTTGDLTADSSLLVTHTTCDSLTYTWDGVDYLHKAYAEINADINANLNDFIFTLSKNSSKLNDINFSLDGWLKGIEEGWDMDFNLNAPEVSFKSILSLVPAMYAESFSDLQTGGKVSLSGFVKGEMVGDYYPSFNLKLLTQNAWFQYPALPKKLERVNIDLTLMNPGKTLDETIIDLSNLSFVLSGNPFAAKIRVENPMTDTKISLKALGKLNLANVREVYPLDPEIKLNGLIELDLGLIGRLSQFTENKYNEYQFNGKLNIYNMLLSMAMLPNPLAISKANMTVDNRSLKVNSFQAKVGKSDVSAQGSVENFLPYVFENKLLTGQLAVNSTYLNVSDLMPVSQTPAESTSAPEASSTPLSVIRVPKNIDFSLTANAKEIQYDKMNFKNTNGKLRLVNEEIQLQNISMDAFGGGILVSGLYNTVDSVKPKVDMQFALKEVVFSEIFKQVETLQKLVPVFSKASGAFSTKLSFNSLLQSDMTPDLKSIVGSGLFSTKSVSLKNVPAVDALATALKKDDIVPMVIKDLLLNFQIKDGKMITQPFKFKVSDVNMSLGGSTSLDKSINYQGNVQLPDKYNLGKLSTFNVSIGGTFSKPKVKVDLKDAAKNLLNEKADQAKVELKKQADELKAKAEAQAQAEKEKAMQKARQQADLLLADAKRAGDKLVQEAKVQGDKLVQQANNPIAKKLAQTASLKLQQEAQRKADALNAKAQQEANLILQKANSATSF